MKIAILGKGGSGKSTISWLLSNFLSYNDRKVLAIDADHNMDLASNLGFEVNNKTRTIHQFQPEYRHALNLNPNDKWFTLFSKTKLPAFSFPVLDTISEKVTYQINNNLFLQVLGLGQEDVLYTDMCSHAHSASLKFYIPLLELEENSDLIIDGVAGTDMLNYGLYVGCDFAIVCLENHINSQRVLDKILEINQQVGIPTYVILNKFQDNLQFKKLEEKYSKIIIGKIGLDEYIYSYDYNLISKQTIFELNNIWKNILNLNLPATNKWEILQKFQTKKLGIDVPEPE